MRLNLLIIINYLTFLLLLSACSSSKLYSVTDEEMYEVFNSTLAQTPDLELVIYHTSYIDKSYGPNFILGNMQNQLLTYNRQSDYYIAKDLEYRKIENDKTLDEDSKKNLLDKINKSLEISVNDFLSNEDKYKMARMSNRRRIWKSSLLKQNLRVTKNKKALRISVPIFNQENTICAYFLRSPDGLELIFCKKDEAGEWYRYAESLVWIS